MFSPRVAQGPGSRGHLAIHPNGPRMFALAAPLRTQHIGRLRTQHIGRFDASCRSARLPLKSDPPRRELEPHFNLSCICPRKGLCAGSAHATYLGPSYRIRRWACFFPDDCAPGTIGLRHKPRARPIEVCLLRCGGFKLHTTSAWSHDRRFSRRPQREIPEA
jgi:hypothetical protein